MAKLLLGSVVGPQGPQGTPGVNGSQGPQGIPGPNEVTATTDVVGLTTGQLLYNNGGKVGSVEIVDNLLSVNPNKPLSANQGKVLKGLIDGNDSAIGQFENKLFTHGGITYYLDAVNGNDDNDGLTASTAFKTWSKTKDFIPKFLTEDVYINIIGNYSSDIVIPTFIANDSRVFLKGDTGVASNHTITSVRAYGVIGGRINGTGLSISSLTSVFIFDGCIGVNIDNCIPYNAGGIGVSVSNSTVIVQRCVFGTSINDKCIEATFSSKVMSMNNSGSGITYGLRALRNASIGKEGTQPTGGISNENTSVGGVIR